MDYLRYIEKALKYRGSRGLEVLKSRGSLSQEFLEEMKDEK